MNMKNYKKTYEDVYSTDRKCNKVKLHEDKISIKGMELDKYTNIFNNFLKDFYINLFNGCVRLSWLRRNFIYYDKKTVLPMNKNPLFLNMAFVKYLRRVVGKDIQIITRGKFFSKIESYFDELFPGFLEGNPFENPNYYKFPFEYISIDYLIAVHQLDDRMKLLNKAEEAKMSYAVFLDYLINHVYSVNEDIGREKYQIKANQDRNFPFYIIDLDKKIIKEKDYA